MVPVDIFLERAIIKDSQDGMEQFLVTGNLGLMIGGKIFLLPVGPS